MHHLPQERIEPQSPQGDQHEHAERIGALRCSAGARPYCSAKPRSVVVSTATSRTDEKMSQTKPVGRELGVGAERLGHGLRPVRSREARTKA